MLHLRRQFRFVKPLSNAREDFSNPNIALRKARYRCRVFRSMPIGSLLGSPLIHFVSFTHFQEGCPSARDP